MSTLPIEFENVIQGLDPKSAAAVEQLLGEVLDLVRKKSTTVRATTPVDANGWPVGHFEKYVGCLAGDNWEPSPDPPPEPTPEW